MPKIILAVKEEQKALWVEAAYAERVTLSEWIRRRCDAGLEGRVELTGVGFPGAWEREATEADEALLATSESQPIVIELPEDEVQAIASAADPLAEAISNAAVAEAIVATSASRVQNGRVIPEHNADPKDKASQEHGKGAKKSGAAKMCEHRVPVGTYCKRCGK